MAHLIGFAASSFEPGLSHRLCRTFLSVSFMLSLCCTLLREAPMASALPYSSRHACRRLSRTFPHVSRRLQSPFLLGFTFLFSGHSFSVTLVILIMSELCSQISPTSLRPFLNTTCCSPSTTLKLSCDVASSFFTTTFPLTLLIPFFYRLSSGSILSKLWGIRNADFCCC